MQQSMQQSGYIEGFYGRLLSWPERRQLLDCLKAQGLGQYLYAPKEDSRHRWQWREPYDRHWLDAFQQFCGYAADSVNESGDESGDAGARGGVDGVVDGGINEDVDGDVKGEVKGEVIGRVDVIAGIAPGLDFDFADLPGGPDFQSLCTKADSLLAHGASAIALLMDDIDADFMSRNGGIEREGEAHAMLANKLGSAVGSPILVVPRIYANELAVTEPDYLPAFIDTLALEHTVIYCGSDVVARVAQANDINQVVETRGHGLLLWDNLYANDYCPRRLFVGPWSLRQQAAPVLLNPTGMVHTDSLLLDIMGNTLKSQHCDPASAWRAALAAHGVPENFHTIAHQLLHPVCNADADDYPEPESLPSVEQQLAVLEQLLWRWKSPLACEWYPHLMSLKHDLLIQQGVLPDHRIRKTQLPPLASRLLSGSWPGDVGY